MFTVSPVVEASLRRVLASRVVTALASPRPVDHYLGALHPLWRVDEVRATVLGLRSETADMVTVALAPNAAWRGFQAGQHVRLGVAVDGVRRIRCYSPTNAPRDGDRRVDLTVKRHPGGVVSGFVHERLRAGAVVTLSQATGDFVLPAVPPPHVLLVSGGSGITPVVSMLRTLLDGGHAGRVDLVHFARRRADVPFARELAQRAAEHAAFHLHVVLTGEPGASLTGRCEPALLDAAVPAWRDAEAWVCGPPGLIAAVQAARGDARCRRALHVERFVLPPAPAGAPGGVVEFAASGRRVASDGRTLLVQAEAAGLAPASGCRIGICQTCRCRKLRGTVRDVVTGALSTEPDVPIRACVSVPVGDVAVAL